MVLEWKNPFKSQKFELSDANKKSCCINRATINWNRLFQFWKAVPKASKAIENATGVEFFKV